jgi:hypothetical protein
VNESSSPQGRFLNCIVTEVSLWAIEVTDAKGKKTGAVSKYPFIGIFNGRENVQMPIGKDCVPPADLQFGDRVDIWCEISQAQKVVGDRAVGKLGLRAIDIQRASKADDGHSRFVPLAGGDEAQRLAKVA